jgi:hypothetical protein
MQPQWRGRGRANWRAAAIFEHAGSVGAAAPNLSETNTASRRRQTGMSGMCRPKTASHFNFHIPIRQEAPTMIQMKEFNALRAALLMVAAVS